MTLCTTKRINGGIAVATLAVVGWSLMVPPSRINKGTLVFDLNSAEPINHWEAWAKYDSEAACKDARQDWIDTTNNPMIPVPASKPKVDLRTIENLMATASQCVASDDPRLKGK